MCFKYCVILSSLISRFRKRARRDDDDPYVIYGDNVFAQALAHFPGFADNVDVLDSRPELIGRLARYVSTQISLYAWLFLTT